MKRMLLPIMVLMLALGAGCSKTESSDKESSDKVIRLRSAVNVTTVNKAFVAGQDAFVAQVCGWESSLAGDMAGGPAWSSTAKIQASVMESSFDLEPTRYYSLNGLVITIRAWYPESGSPKNGQVSFANTAGDVDVMLTQSVSGSNESPVSETLRFGHLSTQLHILVVGNDWDPSEKIKTITVKDVSLPNGLDVVAGKLLAAAAADFVINIAEPYLTPEAEAVAVGKDLMIAPMATNILYIDIETTATRYKNIPVTTPDASFLAGRAYTVTLTCSGRKGIIAGSTIGEWIVGTSGGGVVD